MTFFLASSRDLIALDRSSARAYDDDGHLHVTRTPISKATVNDYLGSEIPNFERLGLQPNRRYALLRDPAELRAAVSTFKNKPLLFDHNPITADAHDHERTVGALSDPEFDFPYLYADLACWSGPAIRTIENRTQAELSAAYRYDADMTPGTFEGTAYDGVMRNIRANHVSLVKKGRAGSDVVVLDAALGDRTMSRPTIADRTAIAAAFPNMNRTSVSCDPVTQRFGRVSAPSSAFVRDTSGATSRIAADAALAKLQRRSPGAAPVAQDAATGRSEIARLFPDMKRLG